MCQSGAPVEEGSADVPADDPCATTTADGTPVAPDPMCQSGTPVDDGTTGQSADDPCSTTNADGTPREPDPMCQSGAPVEEGSTDTPAGVLPVTGGDGDRLLALTALGAVAVGAGAVVVGRRRTPDPR